MKKYDSYKDSGIDWLGEIPEHWDLLSFRFCIDILTDYTSNGSFASLAKNVSYLEEGYSRLVRLTDLRVNLENDGIYVSEDAHHFLSKSELFGGEMLIANVGAYSGLVKMMPFLDGKFTLAPNMFLLRLNQNTEFFYYQLNASFCAEQLKMMAISSAQPKLNKDNIRQLKVLKPSLEEQKAITVFLEDRTEKINELIAKKERLIQLLEEERIAIINQAVTKGLYPDVPMKDSGIDWLGDIPEHWEVKPLKYLVDSNKNSLSEQTPNDLEINYIEIGNVNYSNGIQEYTKYAFKDAPSRARRVVAKGDVIISTVRTYLKAIASIHREYDGFIASTGFAVLTPKLIESEYLGYLVRDEGFIGKIISLSKGVSYPSITSQDLNNIKIPLPNKKEQYEISKFIKSKFYKIDITSISISKEINFLKEYKTTLISEVVTGKIDVRKQKLN